jgi:hypothetical protein
MHYARQQCSFTHEVAVWAACTFPTPILHAITSVVLLLELRVHVNFNSCRGGESQAPRTPRKVMRNLAVLCLAHVPAACAA